jgi:hypothetical protein
MAKPCLCGREVDALEGPLRQDPATRSTAARFLGDYQAVKRGRIGKRIAGRAAGRVAERGLGRLFR